MTVVACTLVGFGLVLVVLFVRHGRVVPATAAAGVFAVATWAFPLVLFVTLAASAVAGLLCASPRWNDETPGHAQGASRGLAAALLLALPAVATAGGVLFAQWQASR